MLKCTTRYRHFHTICRKRIPLGYYTPAGRVCEIFWKYETRGQVLFFRILTAEMSRPMINDIWQSLGLGHVNINNVKELGNFHFFFFFFFFFLCVNLHRPMVNGIRQSLGLDLVYINVHTIFIKILRMKQDFRPGSCFRILTSAKPRPIKIGIPQYLGLEHVNISAYAFVLFQDIPHRPRDRTSFIFSEFRLGI